MLEGQSFEPLLFAAQLPVMQHKISIIIDAHNKRVRHLIASKNCTFPNELSFPGKFMGRLRLLQSSKAELVVD